MPDTIPSFPDRNRLLAALSKSDFALLQPNLRPISLKIKYVFEEPNKRIGDVYFMEEGIASVVAIDGDDKKIEVGIIGREGMTGVPVVMGDHQSPNSTYVQVRGHAQRLTVQHLRQAMAKSDTLRGVLLKFAQAFMIQTAHTAMANGRANIEQRLARWLLMAHDRVDGDEIPLTHEFLSLMLCVRRAGVTVALHALQTRGLIGAKRGCVIIIDRKGIKDIAGGFYGIPEAELARLMN